ncbi:hypothetical protein ILUMI_10268 [Ignelater luminosus]|uniref:Uncharacterized protein n=1 Tax=Ignelater luminosus TaxID=2038154 RepID=A0A8K0D2R5_IGNLU|nr:hypothetical protein ILUMI_10268 [Ignelater luminosus]
MVAVANGFMSSQHRLYDPQPDPPVEVTWHDVVSKAEALAVKDTRLKHKIVTEKARNLVMYNSVTDST